jgi:hypothetical protein
MEAVKRLSLHLCHLKVMPDAANDDDVARLKAHLVGQTRGEPDAEINSFIEGYNARTRGPKLTRLPTEADRREEEIRQLCGPDFLAEIDAFVADGAASGPVDGMRAGIVRIIQLLDGKGPPIRTLDALLAPWAITQIGYLAPATSRLDRARLVPPVPRAADAGRRVGVRGKRRASVAAGADANPMAEPSQARLHYYAILKRIARFKGNAQALRQLAGRRKASANIDATIPSDAMAKLAVYDDIAKRDELLASLGEALVAILRQPMTRKAYYRACGLVAVLVGFAAGRRPDALATLGRLTGNALEDGGRYLSDAATGEPEAWVPREVALLIEATHAWMARHRDGRAPRRLVEAPAGNPFNGPSLSHHMGTVLREAEVDLDPKQLKDWTGVELLRAGTHIEHVRDYLRFAGTEACEARFRLVKEAFEKRAHAQVLANRSGAFSDE